MKPLFALALGAAAALSAVAADAPSRFDAITWLSSDTRDDSGRPRARIGDTLVAFLEARLPQIRHELINANAKRSWQMIAGGEQVCQVSAVRTPEREKLAYFISTQLGPPLQLVVRRDRIAQLPRNAAGEVELDRLLADPALRGALIDGRSYGAFLDRTIAARSQAAALKRYGARDFGSQMLGMLAADRADWSLEYDISLRQSPEAERLTALLQSVPIAGASEPMIAGIACPRTPWGLAAIRAVDVVLGTPAGAQMLREALERWTTPEVRTHYAAQIDAFYRERARPAVIR